MSDPETTPPLLGPVSIDRLIRLASLTLAVAASTKTDPSDLDADGAILQRAELFETYIRGGVFVDAVEGQP
ncbi:MAG: hypothetical protein K2X61_02880 [Caulobacteraceae bacterium]|nr:hypothetical protein [Caulobacteraceae bacterium]